MLIGAKFVVYTDNNPLSYVKTTGKLGATETRWAAELAQFDFAIGLTGGWLRDPESSNWSNWGVT